MTPIYNLGPFGTNCYIIETDASSCILIDAPCQGDYILDKISSLGLTLKLVVLTHGHIDHIGAAEYLRKATGCEIAISSEDAPMLTDPSKSLARPFGMPQDTVGEYTTLCDGDIITVDGVSLKVIATPGHTLGSICLEMGTTLFSGDTLFEGSVGRCDFPNGSFPTLIKSIRRLYDRNINYTVYPGHGNPTDMRYEYQTNPFLEDLRN